ncbi:MAG TPA: hypothetical protein PKC03_10120 [Dokdonella sp.]|nr:hypothetical protein [Dokdonella sp.]
MDKQLCAALAGRASALVEAGDRDEAIGILEELVRSDLPVFDRAMMCMNIAIVNGQMGEPEKALENYARAVDLERETESYFIAQSQAAFFSQLGMYQESIRSYNALLSHPQLNPESREMFLKNIETLERMASQP